MNMPNAVVWDTPSRDSSGSMPLGNGDIGLNVWVEEEGDLLFYLSSPLSRALSKKGARSGEESTKLATKLATKRKAPGNPGRTSY
jgi:hypothetical protein